MKGGQAVFGYVTVHYAALGEEEKARFRACYCGLCRTLGERYGLSARAVLSNDMTFLAMLLSSLYEPSEETGRLRCPGRPWRVREFARSEPYAYAADMNVAFAYYKTADDARDDKNPAAMAGRRLLAGRMARVEALYPEKCRRIAEAVAALDALEKAGSRDIDAAANAMGALFGEVYARQDDFWREPLYALGAAVGRFIYLCDAWEDREADEKKGLYNPLSAYASRPDYDEFAHRILTMMISEGAQAFELLPVERDAAILRNILYSGVWSRWALLHERKAKQGARKQSGGRAQRRTTK